MDIQINTYKKIIFAIIFTFLIFKGYSQKESINLEGKQGPSLVFVDSLIEAGAFLIVNNILVNEKSKVRTFFKAYKEYFKKGKFYYSTEAKKKYGVENKIGVFYYKVKGKIITL